MLYGAVAGAFIVNYAKSFFTAALPEFWLYALGLLFVAVTMFLPRGVVGLLDGFGARTPPSAPAKAATA
jgi:urea transport system permease protein